MNLYQIRKYLWCMYIVTNAILLYTLFNILTSNEPKEMKNKVVSNFKNAYYVITYDYLSNASTSQFVLTREPDDKKDITSAIILNDLLRKYRFEEFQDSRFNDINYSGHYCGNGAVSNQVDAKYIFGAEAFWARGTRRCMMHNGNIKRSSPENYFKYYIFSEVNPIEKHNSSLPDMYFMTTVQFKTIPFDIIAYLQSNVVWIDNQDSIKRKIPIGNHWMFAIRITKMLNFKKDESDGFSKDYSRGNVYIKYSKH